MKETVIHAVAPAVDWIQAAHASSSPPRRFSMLAYTGGMMLLRDWKEPVVVDLEGIRPLRAKTPVLREHDWDRVIGHVEKLDFDREGLRAYGVVSGANEHAREIVDSSLLGFEWQASVGLSAKSSRRVREGQRVTVNGQTFAGPLLVVDRSVLLEISFVANGADSSTSTAVATKAPRSPSATTPERNRPMAKSRQPSATIHDDPDDLGDTIHAGDASSVADQVLARSSTFDELVAAAGLNPRNLTGSALAEFDGLRRDVLAGAKTTDDAAKYLLELMSRRAQLAQVRAGRADPVGPPPAREGVPQAGLPADPNLHPDPVLGVTALRAMGHEDIAARVYGEQFVNASRHIAREAPTMFDCARIFASRRGVDPNTIQASGSGLSTLGPDFAELFTTSIRLVMRDGYQQSIDNALSITRHVPVQDFKDHRLIDTEDASGLVEVPMDGEVSHRQMTFSSRSVRQTTKAELLSIDERQIRGEAATILAGAATAMRYKASQTVLRETFALLLTNPNNFFHTSNNNLLTGAGSALGLDSFAMAVARLRSFTDKSGEPAGSIPGYLVVPPELELYGLQILESSEVTGEAGASGSKNPMRGVAKLIVEPRLSSPGYAGSSTERWYLVATPASTPAMVMGCENGSAPIAIVELMPKTGENFNMTWRVRIDFGVAMYDPRGAVRANGS